MFLAACIPVVNTIFLLHFKLLIEQTISQEGNDHLKFTFPSQILLYIYRSANKQQVNLSHSNAFGLEAHCRNETDTNKAPQILPLCGIKIIGPRKQLQWATAELTMCKWNIPREECAIDNSTTAVKTGGGGFVLVAGEIIYS